MDLQASVKLEHFVQRAHLTARVNFRGVARDSLT